MIEVGSNWYLWDEERKKMGDSNWYLWDEEIKKMENSNWYLWDEKIKKMGETTCMIGLRHKTWLFKGIGTIELCNFFGWCGILKPNTLKLL